eukprot:16313772-Heterocapsa_arctica.AAC.1
MGEAKKTRVIVRDLQKELIRNKEHTPSTDAGKRATEEEEGDKHNTKKHRKNKEEEESDISENTASEIRKAGEVARHSDMKQDDTEEEKYKRDKEKEETRMEEERLDKRKRDTLYQEMIRTEKEEADRLITELPKGKIEANQKDVFELNETGGPWGTGMTTDQALMIRTWITTLDANSMAKAKTSTGRQGIQGDGDGAHGFREEHAQTVLRCFDKWRAKEFARRTGHGLQIQCGGEQQIWMGAIRRNLSLAPATTHAGPEGADHFDGSNVLEHDPAHQECKYGQAQLQCNILAKFTHGNDQGGDRKRGGGRDRRQEGTKEPARQGQCKREQVRQKETVGRTSRTRQPRIAAGRRRQLHGMDAKAEGLGSKGIRRSPEGRFGGGPRTRARRMGVTLELRQEQRRQEVLRGKPQGKMHGSTKDNKKEEDFPGVNIESKGLQKLKQSLHNNDKKM